MSKLDRTSFQQFLEQMESTRANALIHMQSISERFDNLQKRIFQNLRERKQRYEQQERIYGFISYAIIALGVGLSLMAKVFEPEDKAVEAVGAEG